MVHRIAAVLIIVFSLTLIFTGKDIDKTSEVISPAFWPITLLLIMLVLGVFLLFIKDTKTENREESKNNNIQLFYSTILFLALYVILMYYLGFILSTFLFLLINTINLGMKFIPNSLITSIITTAVFIGIFPHLLSIPLPRGIGFFRELSKFFF